MTDTTAPTAMSEIPGLTIGTWTLDPAHTKIGFTVRHLMTKIRGTFNEFSGDIIVKDSIEASTVDVTVDLSSVDTGNEQRDGHLRSSDFFNVETNPRMTFVGSGIRPDADHWLLTGDLTINGTTKPLELRVVFLGVDQNAYGQTIMGLEASGTINRKDWRVDFNIPLEGGRLLIGDKVDINLDVQAALQA